MKHESGPSVFVLLMGGLGNQLFQASAATYFSSSSVFLVSNLANASINRNGQAEIFEIALPKHIKEYKFENIGLFTQKLINFSIRVSVKRRSARHVILEKLLSILISRNSKSRLSVRISDDVGYSESITKIETDVLLIGYFQSWKYAETLIDSFDNREIELSIKAESFLEAVNRIPEKWRLVHVRLGDYLSNGDFGLLSPEYFDAQIDLQDSVRKMPTLVFTNDREKLKEINPGLSMHISELDTNLSSAELLLLCSYASNFVISNSTFSWWAAYISNSRGMEVIAPEPWFRYVNPPTELIPPHWVKSRPIYLDLK